MKTGIYQIRNKINGKRYIGKSNNVSYRFSIHKKQLIEGVHYNEHLQNAFNKYGIDSFDFSLLKEIKESQLDIEELCAIYLFESDDPKKGYNLTIGGDGVSYNLLRDDIKKKRNQAVSKALTGKKFDEKRKQQNWFHEGMKGKKHSKDSREKMSNSLKGKIPWNKGLTKETDERLAKIAASPNSGRFKSNR